MTAESRGPANLGVAILVGVSVVGFAGWTLFAPSRASARDSDNSRLRAEHQEIGTTQKDELDPPDDAADWRYIEVEQERVVQFDLHADPSEASLQMRLTKATGDEIESASCKNGTASLQRKLAPGLYYLEIKGAAASYSISIQ